MPVIRNLMPHEAALVEQHLLRLTPDDRGMRFGGAALADRLVERYCQSIDWTRSIQIGFLDHGVLRGVAQMVYTGEEAPLKPGISAALAGPVQTGCTAAEFAVSVERGWREEGVGTRLMRRLTVVARNRSVRELYMYCRSDNLPMRRLAKKAGINLVFNGGELEGHAALDAPNQLTVFAEFASAAAGIVDRATDFWTPEQVAAQE